MLTNNNIRVKEDKLPGAQSLTVNKTWQNEC